MILLIPAVALALLQTSGDSSQGFDGSPLKRPQRVDIPFNRLYGNAELLGHFDALQAAWPELVSMEVIGHSTEGRELRVYTLNNASTGAAADKPAMWVDANVHGNEIQGGEATLYLAWYLLENYGHNPRTTELLDRAAFYIQPIINPDGRYHWVHDAHGSSSSRTGYEPTDNDRDGRFDEDPADDLDGDGHITSMRKYVPGEGTHRLNADDPRIMERVPSNDKGIRGDWIYLGSEGIDNDGDGRFNEDSVGGYDMNRAWPALYRPGHVQYGAGPYPLYWPETRAVAEFLYAHPNVAAVQSFHNSGGMILRGPGSEAYGDYDYADLRAFDELGKNGEKMLPFYSYMILWKDLYPVFGGFATWTYEGLGIISFTNELWTSSRMFPDEEGRADRRWFDDHLLSGGGYIEWHPVQHPFYGEIEVGGYRKDFGRVPPTFLIEEMVHRNALFCIEHAEAMPEVKILSVDITPLANGVKAIDVIFRNDRVIPTRTGRSASKGIGEPDTFTIEGEGLEVLAGGFRSDRWRPERIELAEREPARLLRESGIKGREELRVRWFVTGRGTARIGWSGETGRNKRVDVEIP